MRGDRSNLVRAGFIFVAAVALVFVAASTSHAEEDYADPGWYGGLSGSVGYPLGGTLDRYSTGLGVAFNGGYRLQEQISIEGAFEWISGFGDPTGLRIDSPIMMTANVKAYALTGQIQPWVMLGVGVMTLFDNTTPTEVTRLGMLMRFGAGFDYWVTPQIAITSGLNFIVPMGRIEGYQFFTTNLGATYRF